MIDFLLFSLGSMIVTFEILIVTAFIKFMRGDMNRSKLRKILDNSDIVTQMVVAIEELSELQKELTKYIRFFRSKGGDYYRRANYGRAD